jgi:hypothetical protein
MHDAAGRRLQAEFKPPCRPSLTRTRNDALRARSDVTDILRYNLLNAE